MSHIKMSNIQDGAWAAIYTPFEVDELIAFCSDIERLYRINPYLEFKQSTKLDDSHYRFIGKNTSQDPEYEFDVEVSVKPTEQGFILTWSNGIKATTEIRIEASDKPGKLTQSKLTIMDTYALTVTDDLEKNPRLREVDKSLITWIQDIQKYLLGWHRWSKFRTWRWYMRKVWQPMKPSGRRITYMMLWITVVEIALISLGAAIYYVEFT